MHLCWCVVAKMAAAQGIHAAGTAVRGSSDGDSNSAGAGGAGGKEHPPGSTPTRPSAAMDVDGGKEAAADSDKKKQPVPGDEESAVRKKRSDEEDGAKVKDPQQQQQQPKVQDKSRPISSTPVPGTPWCVVWTGDGRVFFYNPSSRTSVWERPEDLVGRTDVDKMLATPPDVLVPQQQQQQSQPQQQQQQSQPQQQHSSSGGSSAVVQGKKRTESDSSAESDEDTSGGGGGGSTPAKKPKKDNSGTVNSECMVVIFTYTVYDDVICIQLGNGVVKKTIDIGKEAAIEAEVRAAKERAVVPLEVRVKSFKEMLAEKDVSAFSTWEKELHKIVFDARYLLLTSKERKQVFERYVKERAEDERREKRNKLRERKDAFRKLLSEAHLHGK